MFGLITIDVSYLTKGVSEGVSGLTLKPPVPRPKMMMAMMNAAIALSGFLSTDGAAPPTRITWPTSAVPIEMRMVLYLPR
jgi:hypothetical protein